MGNPPPLTHIEQSEEFGMRNNLFMIFRYEGEEITRFAYIISQRAFYTFIASNQETGTKLIEEPVQFPPAFIGGVVRQALVHYQPDGSKLACYVPVFPTEAEIKEYERAVRR